jgi:hypothetical protein
VLKQQENNKKTTRKQEQITKNALFILFFLAPEIVGFASTYGANKA